MLRFQGLTFARHICCICFETKEDDEWWEDEHSDKVDVCIVCKEAEDEYLAQYLQDEYPDWQ